MAKTTIITERIVDRSVDRQLVVASAGAVMPAHQSHAVVRRLELFGLPMLDDPCPPPTLDSPAVCGPYYGGTWVWRANEQLNVGWELFKRELGG